MFASTPSAKRRSPPAPAALLVVLLTGVLLTLLGAWLPAPLAAQGDNLLARVSDRRVAAFERQQTNRLQAAIEHYIPRDRFAVSVKVIWNPNVLPEQERQETQVGPRGQKLPGFPLYVNPPDRSATDDSQGSFTQRAPAFVRMVVYILLDSALPTYYDRFLENLVPVLARFDPSRGDKVDLKREQFPYPLARPPLLSTSPGTAADSSQLGSASGIGAPTQDVRTVWLLAQVAFEDGRLGEALRITEEGFERAATHADRGRFLAMQGSIHFSLGNRQAARQAWQRAVSFDPNNLEAQRALEYLGPAVNAFPPLGAPPTGAPPPADNPDADAR